MILTFTVHGEAQPQGSMRPFVNKKTGRAIVTSDNRKLKPWRQEVAWTALHAMSEAGLQLIPRPCGVAMGLRFYFLRPKSLAQRIGEKTTQPDVDKCLRAIFDALTGICYEDDAQVCKVLYIDKAFGTSARTEIEVRSVEPSPCERMREIGKLFDGKPRVIGTSEVRG